MSRACSVLDSITLLRVSTDTFERAAELEPFALGSPDVIHLAVAVELGDELDGIVTYDIASRKQRRIMASRWSLHHEPRHAVGGSTRRRRRHPYPDPTDSR